MKKEFLFLPLLVSFFLLYLFFSPFSDIIGQVVSEISTDEKIIYLTFDDGPGYDTLEILNILRENNIKATFFVVGENAKENPDILKIIEREGHTIGVHSMSHDFLMKDSYLELKKNADLVENITGQRPKLFRPPYGFRTYRMLNAAKDLGMITVTWSSFPMDYSRKSDDIVSYVISGLSPGQIICLHDGPANRQQTVSALREIIKKSKEKGYRFGNLEESIF